MLNPKTTLSRIDIVDVEPRLAAVVRKSVAFADMPHAQRAARAALDTALTASRMQPIGGALTVWRMPQGGVIDYAPGVFVPERFAGSGGVSLFTLPRGQAAHLHMKGSYEGLAGAWQSLFQDCAAEGLQVAGLNWEIYAAPDTPPDSLSADLYALLA